jgi:hypothetical protein
MDQPPLDNPTDFIAHPQVLVDRDGEKLVTIVKATFQREADGTFEVAPKKRRRGIRMADVPWGKPEKSSILFPADLCLRKPGTDVVVVAKAFAPGGRPVPTFDAAVRIGPLEKIVRVFGLRVWTAGGGGLSRPSPIAEVEMRYDLAWGGCDTSDPARTVEEPRNPVGMGVTRDPDSLTHQPAPSLEDPAVPILTCRTRPPPAGMGAIGRHWEPRRRYSGTYDARWVEERAPLPPLDQDDRVNLCATPELCASPPLRGGEEVALLNLTPGGGAAAFALPRVAVEIEFRVKDRPPEVFRPFLDTVLIDVFPRQPAQPITVELVWRAHVKAPRRMKDARILVREREAR